MAAPQTWVRDHAKGPGAYKRAPEPEPITVPETAFKAMKMGLQSAAIPLRQMGQNLVNNVRGNKIVGKEERFASEQKRAEDIDAARDYYVGDGPFGFLKEAAVRVPGNMLATAPEVAGPKKYAAPYHGLRKLAETGSVKDALIATGSNLAGEKLEGVVDKIADLAPMIRKMIPKDVPGNAGGMILENWVSDAMSVPSNKNPGGRRSVPKMQPKPTHQDYAKRPNKKKKDASLASK